MDFPQSATAVPPTFGRRASRWSSTTSRCAAIIAVTRRATVATAAEKTMLTWRQRCRGFALNARPRASRHAGAQPPLIGDHAGR